MRQSWKKVILVSCLLASLLLSSCAGNSSGRPSTAQELGTPQAFLVSATPRPTFTPTLPPLGSEGNPLVMAIVAKEATEQQRNALAALTESLSRKLEMSVSSEVFTDYIALETALQKGRVHLAWLQPEEYLLASQKGLLTSLLVANHFGVSAYGVQFLGHRDGGFSPYYDLGTNTTTGSAGQALAQFSGLRPCLTKPNSLAGYWVPMGYLAENSVPVQEPVLTYTYVASLRTLYVKGVCDFTATYAISGDPRSSSELINEFPDLISKLPVIWVSPAIIPNLNLSVSPNLELALQVRLADQLMQYSRSEEGRVVLSDTHAYDIAQLDALPDDAYSELRNLLAIQNVRLPSLLTPSD